MKKRVLLLTQWFEPEPTFKGLLFAKELARQGFDVEVLTGFPNYPGGKLYPGYRIKLIQKEVTDGINVTRVPLYPSHNQSAIKRIFNYISFCLSAIFYGLFFLKRPDVIYAYHPPLTVGVSAAVIGKFRNVPVVYDIQDMWPDTLRATGMLSNKKILSIISRVCDWVYRRVDSIVVLSPGFRRLLIERGVSPEKVEVIYNWADEGALGSPVGSLSADFPVDKRFKIVFAGNMGNAQALDSVLDAANLLQTQNSNVVFVLIGGGVDLDRLKARAHDLALINLIFLPAVPMAEIGNVLSAADALLVHLRKDELFKITIPSKTQAYMSVGKPLLIAVDGDAADLVSLAQCGFAAESENAESIAARARDLERLDKVELEAMGRRARDFYFNNMSLQAGVSKFVNIFNRLFVR